MDNVMAIEEYNDNREEEELSKTLTCHQTRINFGASCMFTVGVMPEERSGGRKGGNRGEEAKS